MFFLEYSGTGKEHLWLSHMSNGVYKEVSKYTGCRKNFRSQHVHNEKSFYRPQELGRKLSISFVDTKKWPKRYWNFWGPNSLGNTFVVTSNFAKIVTNKKNLPTNFDTILVSKLRMMILTKLDIQKYPFFNNYFLSTNLRHLYKTVQTVNLF